MARALIAVLMLAGGTAEAAMRCGTHLITEGLATFEVQERCGPPDYESVRTEFLRIGEGFVLGLTITIEEWIYDRGSNKFRRRLIFENGRLEEIETLNKALH